VSAQVAQGPPPPAAAAQPARTAAPVDITGTWASVVTEDWQWRFITPAKGDYTAVPLTAEANKIAQAWDPDADVKAGNQCKPFGAAAIMRLPTRMQVSWTDDNTMKLDWDLGTQSRLVYFDKTKQPGPVRLQGHAIGDGLTPEAAVAAAVVVVAEEVVAAHPPHQQRQRPALRLAVRAAVSLRPAQPRAPRRLDGVAAPQRQLVLAGSRSSRRTLRRSTCG
jgi:hypothetical protein